MEDLLLYFKEKIQVSGKALVLREVHHEECARKINQKYETNFTWKQVYYKYHKLKGEWKVILEAKSASGASFDDVQKKIIYDEIEVVKMKAKGDKRAKFYNVPIPFYDDMEFVFTSKHATGEFSVLQAPFDHPSRHDEDDANNGRSTQEQVDVDNNPFQHCDSDTLPDSNSPTSVSPKHKSEGKEKKGSDRRVSERCPVTPTAAECLQAVPAAAWGPGAPLTAEKAYLLSTEDEQREYASQPPVFNVEKNCGQFNKDKKRRQAGQRNPTSVEKMHSSKPCSTALSRNKCKVHAVNPEESDHDKCRKSENFTFSCCFNKRMCTRVPSLTCGAHLLVMPCAGLHDGFDNRPVGCRCAPLEEDEEHTWRQSNNEDHEQGAPGSAATNGKEPAHPGEIFEALRAIPSMARTDLLRAYSMLIHDDRRFRSLVALPMEMRKDWLLMELENQLSEVCPADNVV